MRLHFLRHMALEDAGSIAAWASDQGCSLAHTLLYESGTLPAIDSFDWLLILGGPMNIYEEERFPWLAEEKLFIRAAIAAGKVVIGFCLGAQLIADVLGGRVTRSREPEIGWLPVRWSAQAREHPLFSFFPETSMVLEWHYDTFSVLPPEAEALAGSEGCAHQLFMYKERVFGFQFHLEANPEMLERLVAVCGSDMQRPSAYVQSSGEVLARKEYIVLNNLWLAEFLTRLKELERRRKL
ncbi:type 1 glutamine amidotransferase [Paenibacillus sp. S150]|nr:type 1 glutamine amidotransferase [Paenibacillus sp. S150]